MKKILWNLLFAFIFGAVLFSTITLVIAANYNASDIEYKPSDSNWKVDNVADAIESLYGRTNYVYGEQTSTNYGKRSTVTLGFKPKIVAAIIPTSGGYLRTVVFVDGETGTAYDRGSSMGPNVATNVIKLTDDGFTWEVYDSSWGSQTIKYYAFK